jgi:hypothetical protein
MAQGPCVYFFFIAYGCFFFGAILPASDFGKFD